MAAFKKVEKRKSTRPRRLPRYLDEYEHDLNRRYEETVDRLEAVFDDDRSQKAEDIEDDEMVPDDSGIKDPAVNFLIGQRQVLIDVLMSNHEKLEEILKRKGSRSRAKRIIERSWKTFTELTDVLTKLGSTDEDAQQQSIVELRKFRQIIEGLDDLYDRYMESREGDAPSEVSFKSGMTEVYDKRMSGVNSDVSAIVNETRQLMVVEEQDDDDDDDDDHDDDDLGQSMEFQSLKSDKIKELVAEIKVKQEKDRYLMEEKIKTEQYQMEQKIKAEQFQMEQKIKTERHQLELKKAKDELARSRLEAKLWKQDLTGPMDRKSESELKKVKDELARSKLETELWKHDLTGPMDRKSDADQETAPVVDEKKSQERNLQQFFQGIAKPKLRMFNGFNGYFDWKEQFSLFVDQVDIPSKHKMVMLKSLLSGKPLQLIENLGYTDHQYQAALTKLEDRYGGKRRLVQRHLQLILANNKITPDDLKSLERFSDMIADTVASLIDQGGETEVVGDTAIYTVVLQKLPEKIVMAYQDTEPEVDGLRSLSRWLSKYVTRRLDIRELNGSRGIQEQHRPPFVKKDRFAAKKKEPVLFPTHTLATISEKDEKCPICPGKHRMISCAKWRASTTPERWNLAKSIGACYRCLRTDHRGGQCPMSRTCGIAGCNRTHHRDLHNHNKFGRKDEGNYSAEPKIARYRATKPEVKTSSHNTLGHIQEQVIPNRVALRLIPVWICGIEGRVKVNALLDEGSDTTYIRESVVNTLNLGGPVHQLRIATVGNEVVTDSVKVKFKVTDLKDSFQREVEAWTVTDLCDRVKVIDWRELKERYHHLQDLEFPDMSEGGSVDLLIGSNYPEMSVCLDERIGNRDEPIARLTPLGWSCVGRFYDHTTYLTCCTVETVHHCYNGVMNDIDEQLRRLWNWDISGPDIEDGKFTVEEKKAWDIVMTSLLKLEDRFQVAIPWREEIPALPDNRETATKRLRSLEASMRKRPEIAERYQEVFNANIEKGYIRKVESTEAESLGWYLPHFAVIREDKATTKVRIVYDAAATFQGTSLNDRMYTGPNLQSDIVEILLRFRRSPICLIGDIKEMFNQVVLDPKDRKFHRLLWRNFDTSKPIETYEAVRLVFGDRASPFLAQFVMQHQAKLMETEHPEVAELILNSIYMDDAIDSFESPDAAIKIRDELTEVLKQAGMHIRRWCSNSLDVLDGVPAEDVAVGVNLSEFELPSVKTLGVKWDALQDIFTFSTREDSDSPKTKRQILSKVATTYDPLQFLAPLVIRGKMLLQEAWLAGIDWDEELPSDLMKSAQKWYLELGKVDQISIPRGIRNRPMEEVAEMAMHVFSDASKGAYAAAAYLRCLYNDGTVEIGLVAAKAKVAPLRAISIPRLELMGAVLGVRLLKKITKILPLSESCTFWTDSTDVVHWVKGQSRRYKPFVANRVSEIHATTLPCQWRHVPGKLNPADDASRGLNVDQMMSYHRWFQGPGFLRESEETWPKTEVKVEVELSDEVRKEETVKTITNMGCSTETQQPWIDVNRFSCWYKLRRVVSRVLQFVKLLQKKIPRRKSIAVFISPAELWEAECVILRQAQQGSFETTLSDLRRGEMTRKSSVRGLAPMIGPEGLLRVGGRLQFSSLPFDARHPIMLPKNHHVTTLIIRECHLEGYHVRGVNGVLAELRVKYWPIDGREAVKRLERNCIVCKKRKRKLCQQAMAPLPRWRTEVPLRAFAFCGLDYGGPFVVKLTRRCRAKRYLCLFTCLSSRAVHLEVAYGLDTASFLNALSRMIARRGNPEEIVSDNGSNFIGGEREIRELLEAIDQDEVSEKLAKGRTKWNWNPPYGSHHGGVFEIMIKAAKRAIYAILHDACPTDEELLTVVTEVEGLLNSRPLTYCNDDSKDEQVLTPNHFLYGQAGGQLAPQVIDEVAFNPRNRWRYVQDLIRKVWVRWQKEFLSLQQNRPKWQVKQENLKVDDIVLMADSSNPRGRWPLGRIVEVFPGVDGLVRIVKVYAAGKVWRRPITSLSLLESQPSFEDKS